MRSIVLDASVVIKWFLLEKLSQKAIKFRFQHLKGEIVISAPSLLIFEITNVLCTKKGINKEVISSALNSFYAAEVKEYPFDKNLTEGMVKIAKKFKITAYDACYLALAQKLACRFYTADEKLYRKVSSLKFVRLFS